ncbi:O-antigen ligase family protein [Vibrio ostreicida]|uniref:O-antigen ligase family protein n=1 Tax=Vibrio ostreicida TaxID=526588 RepID=A0ABT8BPX5_9VIBR|nr:O-antigen ligase family protein [Vibrio ostreicida]MDN3608496.1 O-antigen ligase family protein [Vibrio ostreicida]NPD10318.1 O-antigen ligase family protein [Vibrio ostreicida]
MTINVKRNNYLIYFSSISIFLVLFFLLSTNNFTVAVAAFTVIISTLLLFINREKIGFDNTDKLVVICLSSYFLSNIPLSIIDSGEFRYFRGASRIALCIPVYFFFKYIVTINDFHKKPLIWGTILGSLGAFSVAFYQFFIEGRIRVDGFLFSINFGYLSCLLAVLSLTLFTYKYYRPLLIVSFSLSTLAMLMTLTRGAILALPLAILLMVFLDFKKIGYTKACLAISMVAIISIGLYQNSPSFKQRVDYTVSETKKVAQGDISRAKSTGGRIMLWRASLEAFKIRPLFGLTYPERESLNLELAERGIVNNWVAGVKRGHAHSQYFEQIATGGLIGVIALTFTLLIPFIYFFRKRKRSQAAYIATFFILALSICCLTEVALQQNLISTFYGYMLALLFAVTQHEINQNALHGEVNDKLEIET